LDRHEVVIDCGDGVVRQPRIELCLRLLARVYLEPRQTTRAAVGDPHRAVEPVLGRTPDVGPGDIPLDDRKVGRVRYAELAVAQGDRIAVGGGSELLKDRSGRSRHVRNRLGLDWMVVPGGGISCNLWPRPPPRTSPRPMRSIPATRAWWRWALPSAP